MFNLKSITENEEFAKEVYNGLFNRKIGDCHVRDVISSIRRNEQVQEFCDLIEAGK